MTTDPTMLWLAFTYGLLTMACLLGLAIPWRHERRQERAEVRERNCTRPCHSHRRWQR